MLRCNYTAGRAAVLGRRMAECRLRLVPTVPGVRRGCSTSITLARGAAPDVPSPPSSEPVHVTIVGGGAAGLTAAFFAAEHGAKVTVLERTREAGKKILMSGGSRCNVLPLEVDLATDYFSDSAASAVRAVFASWNLELCKAWLEDPYWGAGVDMTLEEETKKWFPTSNSSKEVRDRLVAACEARGVQFIYNASVEGLVQLAEPQQQRVQQQQQQQQQQPPSDLVASGAVAAEADAACAADRRASGAEAGTSQPEGAGTDAAAATPAPKRGKKGKGKGRGGSASATADGPPPPPTKWLCKLKDGTEHVTDKLVVATGGLSFPAVGTDGTGHRLLARLGHSLRPTYAALTPLVGKHPAGQQLAGVSMYDIELSVQLPGAKKPRVSERTALLFTHKGYSGPAVLDLSHHAVKALTTPTPSSAPAPAAAGAAVPAAVATAASAAPAAPAAGGSGTGAGAGAYLGAGLPSLRVNWTHEPAAVWDERLRAGSTAQVANLLQRNGLKERLAEALTAELGLTGRRVCDLRKQERAALVAALTSYELQYTGHEGYKKAEVTGGGVPLEELDCATMESRLLPGLFLCGECVDVFGRIGGFNFYWAWVSGRLAGVGAAQGGLHPQRRAKKQARAGSNGGMLAPASAVAAAEGN
ncbi:hypothetical protein HYH02_002395 [Chlamydomonas schloesseri]|uniref:FAD-dependent oxidoreductase 2 FAD binding domain-containing protein n=1 Tax=Chlamydomonas schloesseri TaxID=2026947 RepID=A0A835WTA6_9CHLO|nr:hypothetical protein HYH02_002395 [Chlamydomonas schloesseri]|eukprot:KAG2453062.1 hypothetical protein HYH02_002395 [Chlamydomonas schloesseri]